jgi:hypothetical protein
MSDRTALRSGLGDTLVLWVQDKRFRNDLPGTRVFWRRARIQDLSDGTIEVTKLSSHWRFRKGLFGRLVLQRFLDTVSVHGGWHDASSHDLIRFLKENPQ